jgi:Cu(I)/Ag(I) efflux system membrane protein CusA/SilA
MLIYLTNTYKERCSQGKMNMCEDLYDAVIEGVVERVRPKLMTVTALIAGLLSIMWGTGTGADVMKRIAAPMVGGMVISSLMELLVLPAIYVIWKGLGLKKEG